MSLGRRRRQPEPAPIQPLTTRFEVNAPTGDRVISEQVGTTQRINTELSPLSQRLVGLSSNEVNRLANTLARPNKQREQKLVDLSNRQFTSLSDAINRSADDQVSLLRSQNAQRFGGSLNSTFGNDAIARVEGERQRELRDARLSSDLDATNRLRAEDTDRINRLNVFNGLLNGFENTTNTFGSLGSNALQRSQQLATQRASAIDRFNLQSGNTRRRDTRQLAFEAFRAGSGLLGGLNFSGI